MGSLRMDMENQKISEFILNKGILGVVKVKPCDEINLLVDQVLIFERDCNLS